MECLVIIVAHNRFDFFDSFFTKIWWISLVLHELTKFLHVQNFIPETRYFKGESSLRAFCYEQAITAGDLMKLN